MGAKILNYNKWSSPDQLLKYAGCYLKLENDGNLFVADSDDIIIWSLDSNEELCKNNNIQILY